MGMTPADFIGPRVPAMGQTVRVEPVAGDETPYVTKVLVVSPSGYVTVELPDLGSTPVTLRTPRGSWVYLIPAGERSFGPEPSPSWLARVNDFGAWGVGLEVVRELAVRDFLPDETQRPKWRPAS